MLLADAHCRVGALHSATRGLPATPQNARATSTPPAPPPTTNVGLEDIHDDDEYGTMTHPAGTPAGGSIGMPESPYSQNVPILASSTSRAPYTAMAAQPFFSTSHGMALAPRNTFSGMTDLPPEDTDASYEVSVASQDVCFVLRVRALDAVKMTLTIFMY